jgi:hypothetical protein
MNDQQFERIIEVMTKRNLLLEPLIETICRINREKAVKDQSGPSSPRNDGNVCGHGLEICFSMECTKPLDWYGKMQKSHKDRVDKLKIAITALERIEDSHFDDEIADLQMIAGQALTKIRTAAK